MFSSLRIGKDPALESWVSQENHGNESMKEIRKSKLKLTTEQMVVVINEYLYETMLIAGFMLMADKMLGDCFLC